ncbi:Beta-arabinofuranosyltransferase RAY1 [Cardamine amara subsp. amara]|uniref:Beta-arabinofuranosyltransferase RAY1 n=1 Tax=Cardamine amara subsp. amara TaxID=228776 RepID=A0ABD1BHY7_CARAN
MKLKGLRAGLLSVWLSGFLLIALSFYGTQLLSPSSSLNVPFRYSSDSITAPRITIFTTLYGSSFEENTQALLAIRSWLALSSQITIVLFTQHNPSSSFTDKFGSRLLIDSTIDFTFLGTPFLHSMLARIEAYKSDIAVLMDPETVLLPDLISALNHAHELDRDWLLVSSSVYIPRFPFHWDESGHFWRQDSGKRVRFGELQKMMSLRSWQSNSSECKMIMAWNNLELPLHCGVLPPFLYQRGTYNQWIVNEAMSCKRRFVFDATSTISSFFLGNAENMYNRSDNVSELKTRNWEYIGNSHLGQLYGSLLSKSYTLPKLLKCNKRYMFVSASDRSIDLSIPKGKSLGFRTREKISACISRTKSRSLKLVLVQKDKAVPPPLKFPFDVESLLPLVADKNRTIVLSIAGYSYKDMLMSWACRLRRLEVPNFLVCALDDETYRFLILQGLPVFIDPYAPKNISFNDCHFGSKCFQRVTKVKSRTVLKILKLGYNVLLSDVDVYWFRNPLPLLHSFGPSVLAAQSDEYNLTVPINRPRRLNSGFYFAQSNGPTIAAIEKVVKHAATSGLSEQPSFYDTLCGEGGAYRLGDDKCVEPETNLTVQFLDRELFPNGAYGDLWLKNDVRAECEKKHCFVLHNNWISGRLKKLERQMMKGLWQYDASMRMCV